MKISYINEEYFKPVSKHSPRTKEDVMKNVSKIAKKNAIEKLYEKYRNHLVDNIKDTVRDILITKYRNRYEISKDAYSKNLTAEAVKKLKHLSSVMFDDNINPWFFNWRPVEYLGIDVKDDHIQIALEYDCVMSKPFDTLIHFYDAYCQSKLDNKANHTYQNWRNYIPIHNDEQMQDFIIWYTEKYNFIANQEDIKYSKIIIGNSFLCSPHTIEVLIKNLNWIEQHYNVDIQTLMRCELDTEAARKVTFTEQEVNILNNDLKTLSEILSNIYDGAPFVIELFLRAECQAEKIASSL